MHALISLCLLFCGLLLAGPNPENDQSGSSPPETVMHESSESVTWLHSLKKARQIAAERRVPLLLHFEASWCGACRRMDDQVLNTASVHAFLGSKIVGVRVDANLNRALIDHYGIDTLPTELVIAADGTEGARFVGVETKSAYLARLQAIAASDQSRSSARESEPTRTCLIKHGDGKMVGLGRFSPVALTENREWHAGKEEFIVSFQGVDYFLQSADEADRFRTDPKRFIPHLHGCDPVELQSNNRAQTGVIELGTFYKGELFFFASVENRSRFQNNPTWYLRADTRRPVRDGDEYPFLRSTTE